MNLLDAIGFTSGKRRNPSGDDFLLEYTNLKLAALNQPIFGNPDDYRFINLSRSLLHSIQEKNRLLHDHLCPVDQRIQQFINHYLPQPGTDQTHRLPTESFILDRHGIARILSVPPDKDHFSSPIVKSYRTHQGILHNPTNDRRTTAGAFHIAEGGFPVPGDKISVPTAVFGHLLQAALNPPEDLLALPFTSSQQEQARLWVSLYIRPLVLPQIPGYQDEKRMEIRFFAPGNLVGNLDFVESIFGNAGDPWLAENDAALAPANWTGHSGCVILAPHLVGLRKKDLGLPHRSEASAAAVADGMCWEDENECYNDGQAFKISARNNDGVILTLIADNYFGYCKKEVKTQISFSSNLYGLAEEEHAGGAIAFSCYDLGEDFRLKSVESDSDHRFTDLVGLIGDSIDLQPGGWAIDKKYPDIHYVPEDAFFNLREQSVSWSQGATRQQIRLEPGVTYLLPSGYKVAMVHPHESRRWRLVGTAGEGVFCHKPCTVSGGGKSEISKSISDAILTGPVIVTNFQNDFDRVEEIINREYGSRFRDPARNKPRGRPLLSNQRSLGSVVKLLTPSSAYTDEYNAWLRTIPYYIKELVFVVKRFYKEIWGDDWRQYFKVDLVNGVDGNELKYRDTRLLTQYLRVGFTEDGSWRTFGLRKDFYPAVKLQIEDDISVSTIAPASRLSGLADPDNSAARKFVANCEYRLFQRPDDAIIRGYDKKTERDMAADGNFFCNYEPLSREAAAKICNDTIRFDQFTRPMKKRLRAFLADDKPDYVVCSANPRLVDGKPSKNPRYLQDTQNLEDPRAYYLADQGARLHRKLKPDQSVLLPVDAVLPGRRNNPREGDIRPLAVFNPIHYLPLPELFIEFICSMTGKSPSTTGAGSEGALTKGPFNALLPITDLNNALLAYLLMDAHAFVTAAGWVGPRFRVDHDLSLLVPEIWCRMRPHERHPDYLIQMGYLEKIDDMEHNGSTIPSSLLGYRITNLFTNAFFGRIFANPGAVFTDNMLKPELQDMDSFAEAMDNISQTHKRVAAHYFQDGSIEGACPPLRALLHIMLHGHCENNDLHSTEVRSLFDRNSVLSSDWYRDRLATAAKAETIALSRGVAAMEAFLGQSSHATEANRLNLQQRLNESRIRLKQLQDEDPAVLFQETIGCDPFHYQLTRCD